MSLPSFRDKAEFTGVTVVRQTAKALLVDIDGDEVWIPQSQIDDDSEVYKEGTSGKLVISQYIAEEKRLV